jgi:hypothetical protein
VRAEFIGLGHATPMRIHFHGPFFAWPDAVPPVVFVGETAAGPAHHRHLEILECLDDVVAIAIGVGDGGFFAHPHAFIDAGAKMLGELAIHIRIDDRSRPVGVNGDRHLHRVRRAGRHRPGNAGRRRENQGKHTLASAIEHARPLH